MVGSREDVRMKRMTVFLMILAMLLCCVPVQAEEAAVPVSGITLSAADLVLATGMIVGGGND